jgi:hypothetical protein
MINMYINTKPKFNVKRIFTHTEELQFTMPCQNDQDVEQCH